MGESLAAGQRTMLKANLPGESVSVEGIDGFFQLIGSVLSKRELNLFA